ncbi:TPA: Rha family transcriptional regulator, partial [Escherichia coli]
MNLSISQKATMTSIEIAELVGKRPDNVKRTIEHLAERGVITFPQIE